MPSIESIDARKKLHKESVDPSISLTEERASWDDYSANLPILSSVALEIMVLAGVECAVLKPLRAVGSQIIVYAHGGGLTSGSIVTHQAFAAELATALNCTLILPNYRLLPENLSSAPSDDLISVYLSLLEGKNFPKGAIFMGGDSSGAGLALTAMTRLRDMNAPLPSGCFSLSGAFDATLSSASIRKRESRDPILSEAVLRHWQSHFGDDFTFSDPLISPLFADLSGIAPTLLIVGDDEVWFDDSQRMYDRLSHAGSASELIVFEGMWHVWPMTSGLPETERAFQLIADFIDQNS